MNIQKSYLTIAESKNKFLKLFNNVIFHCKRHPISFIIEKIDNDDTDYKIEITYHSKSTLIWNIQTFWFNGKLHLDIEYEFIHNIYTKTKHCYIGGN